MVICLRCLSTAPGRIVALRIETWFVRVHQRHHVTRYWECPVCKLSGSKVLL